MKISSLPVIRYFRFNPMTLYELRHAVNGTAFHRVHVVLLLVMLGVAALIIPASSSQGGLDTRTAYGFLSAILAFLALASLLLFPAMTATRLLAERSGGELDLLLITGLTPGAITRGKLLSSLLLNLLFFSSALPFVTFLSLFRGVGLAPALWSVVTLFIILLPFTGAALLLASLRIPKPVRILLLVLALISIFVIVLPMLTFLVGQVFYAPHRTFSYLVSVCVLSALAIMTTIMCLVLTVASLSPPAFDRALPVRRALSLFCVLSFGLVHFFPHSADGIEIWLILWSMILSTTTIASIAERDLPSVRQEQKFITFAVFHWPGFILSSGSLNGLTWSMLSGGLCLLAANLSGCKTPVLSTAAGILLWGLTASLAGYLLHRRTRLARRIPTGYAWIVPIALLGFLGIIESIAEIFASGAYGFNALKHWRILNPFFVFDDETRALWLTLGSALSLALLVLNFSEIRARFAAWRPR